MSQLKLCSTCKKGKFRAKEEGNTRELLAIIVVKNVLMKVYMNMYSHSKTSNSFSLNFVNSSIPFSANE